MMNEKMEEYIKDYEVATNLNQISKNPAVNVLKDLVEKAPVFGKILTNSVDRGLELFQKSKQDKLIQSVIDNENLIAPERIHAVPFVIEYAKTREMLDRLANEKKVKLVCNLFVNYFLKENHEDDVDVYEEYLQHLGQLSVREISLLITLNRYEKESTHIHGLNDFDRHNWAFSKLKGYAKEEWNISESELTGLMTSICRSGFCKEEVGGYLNGYAGGVFFTTQYFEKFFNYIMERENIQYGKKNDI